MRRHLEEVLAQLVAFAEKDDNIRAMVLQGSYVNENVATDDFTDLDPLFYVKDTDAFTKTEDWKKTFGKPISTFADEDEMHDHLKWYTRLTIYDDGFKIDFGFQSVKLAMYANEMPLYRTYVDKDGIVPEPEVSDESKFYVKKPNESEFLDRMNAFFYDSSYVAKALARNEMFFVKHMNSVLQQKIKKLLDWYIGISYDFKVNTGLEGRYYRRYLDEHTWSMLLKTYADGERMNTANALLASFELVRHLGMHISKQLGFSYPYQHEKDMLAYCKNIIDTYL